MIRVGHITQFNVRKFMEEIEDYYNNYNVIDLKITHASSTYTAFIIYDNKGRNKLYG